MVDAPHIMIVESRYYEEIAEELISSVKHELEVAGATYERFEVPGAFEIPTAIKCAIDAQANGATLSKFDGFIALGCVIRGQTTHYDYVCGESARGLQDLALNFTMALGYGILTVENQEQSLEPVCCGGGRTGKRRLRAKFQHLKGRILLQVVTNTQEETI